MSNVLNQEITVVSPHWDMAARAADDSTPSLQAQIDEEFRKIVSPYLRSSGWVCTLTIECGTIVCACR
ncbi:hypothetical protein [Actinomyces sp. 2119]|uniref:hypothetical protein n=1 Tax=Actinomyces sp. 2119 TaxID=2321393 RepID=UPI0011C419C9|nr:hypothetical protein [Actinomyces sp. 2119]